MATPSQTSFPQNLDNELNSMWKSLQQSKDAWKCQQRMSLFDCPETEKMETRGNEAQQSAQLRQLQTLYENVERQVTQWTQLAAAAADNITYNKCNEFLHMVVQSSCLCVKQPAPIVDSESKRSRPKVEIVALCGKISGILQDAKEEFVLELLTVEQARHVAEGKQPAAGSDYKVEWYARKPMPLTWDPGNRLFRAKFTDVVMKKSAGSKWLGGYHLYFVTSKSQKSTLTLWTLSTPFEIVSNRTGQLAVKTRDELWRLAFCTNDSDGSTVALKPNVATEPFLDVFGRWFQGYSGARTGLNEQHRRSISQMLKGQEGVITWERLKRNWMYVYLAAEFVKQHTFLWNAGMLNYCFATREETERFLSQFHTPTMLIRFQQTAIGYLSVSFIMPADESPGGGRHFAHCPLEIYLKRNYTLVQCIEFADLICPRGKRLKAKLRDFKIIGTGDNFEYRQILEEDERNREQMYASLLSKQNSEPTEQAEGGPMLDYSCVKERFKIKMNKFPEEHFNTGLNSPPTSSVSSAVASPQFCGATVSDSSAPSCAYNSHYIPLATTGQSNVNAVPTPHFLPVQQHHSIVPSVSPGLIQASSPYYIYDEDGVGILQTQAWNNPVQVQGYGQNQQGWPSCNLSHRRSGTETMMDTGLSPQTSVVPEQYGEFGPFDQSDGIYNPRKSSEESFCSLASTSALGNPYVQGRLAPGPRTQASNVVNECDITDADLSLILEAFGSCDDSTVVTGHAKYAASEAGLIGGYVFHDVHSRSENVLANVGGQSMVTASHQRKVAMTSVDDSTVMDFESLDFIVPNQQ